MMFTKLRACTFVLMAAIAVGATVARAADTVPPGTRTVVSKHKFDALIERLEKAVSDNKMGLVAQASASRGAAARGVKIAGNAIIMVFRNDYAVRMLEASVPAGVEAPLRIYVTENSDGSASLSYRTPSAVFAPYGNEKINALARELDPIFEKIVLDAAGR